MKCDNEGCNNGTIEVDDFTCYDDYYCAPSVKLAECPVCGGSVEIEDDEN